jgi:hypothetical protein
MGLNAFSAMNLFSSLRKPALLLVLSSAWLWVAGCASTPSGVPLPTVGPMPGAFGPFGGATGYLRVFSATRSSNDGGILYYPHTPYTVYAADGKKATACQNHAGPDDQVPFVVPLAPGQYEVFAAAAGLGRVRVPVIIKRGRLTTVFLERGGMPANEEALLLGAPAVRAADGRIIGAAPRTE